MDSHNLDSQSASTGEGTPVDEEKGDRKFGGCPFVYPDARYIDKYAGDCKTNTI